MAFILKSTKYGYNFLGLARQASLTYRQKKILLETSKYVKLNEVWARSAAALSAQKIQSNVFSVDKNVGHLRSNLKANMVDLHIVERTFDMIKKDPESLTSNKLLVLLNCCGNAAFRNSEENRVTMAKKMWDFAKKQGLKFDTSHYNSLLNVYIENCYEFSLDEFLSDMKKAGVEPNIITYRRLLKSACQHGNISDAGDLLEIMKKKNLTICEYDFCSLIQGHYEAGDLEEGKKIINVMKNRGIEPSQETYVYLLCGYAKHGKIQEMKALMEELKEANVHMNDTCLLNIIYILAVNNHGEEMNFLLNKIDKCYDYEKNCIKIVHRLFHKQKDEEALRLFETLQKMGYSSEFIEKQALGIIEHFVFNRNPTEVINICDKITEKGWTAIAYSHALKKAVLRMDLPYCTQLLYELREKNFPIRSNYFWPLIVRYSENGNQGVISVLKSMKTLSIVPCYNTVATFLDQYYKFGPNSEDDLIKLRRSGVRECHGSLIALWNSIRAGNIENAEFIASTYGIFKPRARTLNLLIRNFVKLFPQDEQKLINIIYYLAHDHFIYNSIESEEGTEEDEIPESKTKGVEGFYDVVIKGLIQQCSQDVLLHVLENAPKERFMIPPNSAEELRRITNSEVLLKEFDASNFSLSEDLLKKKSFNTLMVSKVLDPNGVISLSKNNCAEAEKLWNELGPKVAVDEHFAIVDMFAKHNQYDKAYEAIERLRDLKSKLQNNPHYKLKFRTGLHNLRQSGDVKKMINACKTGVELDLIDDNYILPILRTMFCSDDVPKAVEENYSYIEKVKFIRSIFETLNTLINLGYEDLAEKVTKTLCETNPHDVVYTSLFTAYLANGNKASSRRVLEKMSFRFQMNIFLTWFSPEFSNLKINFDEAMEMAKIMRPLDRTRLYAFILSKYQREKNLSALKMLYERCQDDNTTDPFFLEHLQHCLKKVERGGADSINDSSENTRSAEWSMDKLKELLSSGNSDEVMDKLNMRKLPTSVALKVVFLLAAEGKTSEVILGINKYRFSRHIPEIATEFLKNNKVNEFIEFVNTFTSLKKLPVVYNCFASQEERIISTMKNDEEFFQKCAILAQRCYLQEKYDHLLVFFIKMCVQIREKHSKAEELLSSNDSNIVSRFRSYCLSSLLLSSAEDTDFCKNVLENPKIKSVFSEGLEHFYERIIHFYNDKGDLNTAMSYLEKAKQDGVSEKLSKRLLSSLKSNMENEGSTFPYSALLEEAA